MEMRHSVTLDKEKCKGCTNCLKKCPTEAIRVRNGKAKIQSDRCIDCGECIRACPHHAKQAICDSFSELNNYKYKIALPAPSLYGQFSKFYGIDVILTGLKQIGFDDVVEVAWAAQYITNFSDEYLSRACAEKKLKLPVINSACPAVVRLIAIRFPQLFDHLLDLMPPVDLAAYYARKHAVETTGLKDEDIGVFFISPCPAKITAARYPIGLERPLIDKVLSMSDTYGRLRKIISKIKEPEKLAHANFTGIGWASSGGEAKALNKELYISVDGIENVIKVLEDLEDGKLDHVKFVELNACMGGCVGGCLTVENPFVTKSRIKRLKEDIEKKQLEDNSGVKHQEMDVSLDDVIWKNVNLNKPVPELGTDRSEAIRRFGLIEKTLDTLPGLDCGACGAPSCRALAEDIISGNAQESDCMFILREKMRVLFEEIALLQQYVPPPFRDETKKED